MTVAPSGGSNPTLTIMALALRMAWPLRDRGRLLGRERHGVGALTGRVRAGVVACGMGV